MPRGALERKRLIEQPTHQSHICSGELHRCYRLDGASTVSEANLAVPAGNAAHDTGWMKRPAFADNCEVIKSMHPRRGTIRIGEHRNLGVRESSESQWT